MGSINDGFFGEDIWWPCVKHINTVRLSHLEDDAVISGLSWLHDCGRDDEHHLPNLISIALKDGSFLDIVVY
jgi:hypothetical protein